MAEVNLKPQLRFPEFEGEWSKTVIKNIASKITDGTHDTPKPIEKGIPFLTAIHVRDGFIDFENCYYLSRDIHKKIYARCNPEENDLLMVNIGAGVATSAKVDVDFEFSLKNVALIKPNQTKINPDFLTQIQRRNSTRLRHQISTGGAQPFLSLKEIGKLKLIIPTFLAEQTKIANFLIAVDKRINLLQKKKAELEQYKKGIMQKLFSQTIRFKDENGNDFPDWEEKKLGEVGEIRMGQSPDSKSYNNDFDGLPLIQGNADISNRTSNPRQWTSQPTRTCTIGDLILTVRAPVGSIAKSIHMACIGRGVCAINSYKAFNQEFIFQILLWYEPRWASLEQGSTFTAVSGKDIKNLKFKFPSFPEQTKIANFLSSIDKSIEKVGCQIEASTKFKQGLLQKMFV